MRFSLIRALPGILMLFAVMSSGCAVKVDIVMSQAESGNYMNQPLLGVNAGPQRTDTNDTLTSEYIDIGVKYVRTHDFYDALDMSIMYPDFSCPPTDLDCYDFTESDIAFDVIIDAGLEPYFRIGESWHKYGVKIPVEDQFDNWAQAAVYIIGHYLDRGDFQYVEIGNEHNKEVFWPRNKKLPTIAAQEAEVKRQFHDLFIRTVTALRAAYPELKIGGPGFSPAVGKTATSHWAVDFVVAMRDHRDLNDPTFRLDFISWHIYTHNPDECGSFGVVYIDHAANLLMGDVESHVTEWNVEHDVDDGGAIASTRNTGEGASNLTACWIAMNRRVDLSNFYRGIDVRPPFDPKKLFGYGLFTVDGEYKAIAHAFSLWSEISKYYPQRQEVYSFITGSGGLSGSYLGIYAAAGENTDGDYALLVTNTGSVAVEWTMHYPDGSVAQAGNMTIKEIDASGGYSEYMPGKNSVEIEPDHTQLVLIR